MTQDEAVMIRVHFGKYKGLRFWEILRDEQYLVWLMDNYTPREDHPLDMQFKEALGLFPRHHQYPPPWRWSSNRGYRAKYIEDDETDYQLGVDRGLYDWRCEKGP